MKKLSLFFYEKSTIASALVFTAITFGYLFFVMMGMAKTFEVVDANQTFLGTSFGFSLDQVNHFFSLRSEDMLVNYKIFNAVWDNIFPVLYALMYSSWLSVVFRPFAAKSRFLNLIPFLQMIFDWLENTRLIELTNQFLASQSVQESTVSWASTFSMAKWICSFSVFLLLLIGIIFRLIEIKRLKESKNA